MRRFAAERKFEIEVGEIEDGEIGVLLIVDVVEIVNVRNFSFYKLIF